MKAKLLAFVVLFAFTGTASAEYYLVYPAPYYDGYTCCVKEHKTYKRHYTKYKKKKHVARHSCNTCNVNVYYPAPVYTACGGCGGCDAAYYYAPSYVVYTGRPDDCSSYQEQQYNAYQYPPSVYPPESVTYSY